MKTYRAYWKGQDTQDLHFGVEGVAFEAGGHHDPESAEYLAWLFQPDGDEHVYYCEFIEISIIEQVAA